MANGVRDLSIGRLDLPTYTNDFDQSLGDSLDVVGGGVVAGERTARAYKLTVPVHGTSGDTNPYLVGDRMRRQLVALSENTRVKLQALYLVSGPDGQLNGWLVIGGADLSYDDGGPTLSSYTVSFSDVYRVATLATHRPARRASLNDKRLATTARDYLRTVYGTDYAAVTALPIVYLPVGATDITGLRGTTYAPPVRTGQGGTTPVVTGMVNAEVLSYEQAEATMGLQDDVVIYDRRGMGDVPAGYGVRVAADLPLAWWRLNDVPGTTAAADSGVAGLYAGTYQGAPALGGPSMTHDPGGASVQMNGWDGSYVKVPDAAGLHVVGDMTVEGFLQPVGGIPNLVANPSLEVDLTGWTSGSDANVTVGTFARNVAWSLYGGASMRIAATSTGSAASTARAYGGSLVNLGAVPIIAGRTYSAHVDANVTTAPHGVWVQINWIDASGASISNSTGTAVLTTGVVQCSVTAVAPPTAAYAGVYCIAGVGTSGTADASFDGVTLVEGTVPLAYSATRSRYDVIASKWQTLTNFMAWRFAYDFYLDKLVFQMSSNGSLTGSAVAASNVLGLAAAVVAAGNAAHPIVHIAAAYSATNGRVTFYYNGAAVGVVTGMPASIFAATTTIALGKWEADQT